MESEISCTHLQLAVQETCRFFMQVFKEDEVRELPAYDIIYNNYPDDSRIKIFSFVLSVSIDVFNLLPSKSLTKFINNKVGTWRAVVVKICQIHGADIHHLPNEIDIFAARNDQAIDCLIFDWPFCSSSISLLLEYFSEAFQDSINSTTPYLDDYLMKYNKANRKKEGINIITNAMNWLQSCKRIPSNDSKEILKEPILNILSISNILMVGHQGQYDEVLNEIYSAFDNTKSYPKNRVDPFIFYCQIIPHLRDLNDFFQSLFIKPDVVVEFTTIIGNILSYSDIFDSQEVHSLDLTNTILIAFNTLMIRAMFKKRKSFPKKFENNFKMFINLLNEKLPVNKMLIFSELSYWIDRFKRKRVEMPQNIDEYCPEFVNNLLSESAYVDNLQEYFVRVLLNETIHHVPGVMNPTDLNIIKDVKHLQKLLLECIKNAAYNLAEDDSHFPPINYYQVKMLYKIVQKIADNFDMELQEHFSEKISRTIEKFNETLLKGKEEIEEHMDDKSLIIPLCDDFDYKKIMRLIWFYVNQRRTYGLNQPIDNYEYLNELRQIVRAELPLEPKFQADRIISRLVFYTGWRFKLRCEEISRDEIFKFQTLFYFITKNLDVSYLFIKELETTTLALQSFDPLKFEDLFENNEHSLFDWNEFFHVAKLDVVKSRMTDMLRGNRNSSTSSLKVSTFPKYKRGFETTKALISCVRQVFCKINDVGKDKKDNSTNYLNNVKLIEADIPMICNCLNANVNQVNTEILYMSSIIKNSIKDPEIIARYEARLEKNLEKNSRKRKSVKKELIDENGDDSKRIRIDGNEMCSDDNDYEDNEKYDNTITLHHKVNFINILDPKRSINFGDMIESRISYSTESNDRTICIDPGKGKSRPARYVEISQNYNRKPIAIKNLPAICSKRNKNNTKRPIYNFQAIREIGNGVYGKVCEAICKLSNRRVALKRVALNQFQDEGISQSILREISILQMIDHRNVIELIDVVVDDLEIVKSHMLDHEMVVPKSFCFAFEYVEHDLYGLMKSKSMVFSYDQIGLLTKQLFIALEYLHHLNIIHRDVIPSNIFITNQGILKLGDFGNARRLNPDLSGTNTLVLTPRIVDMYYRAPELLMEMEVYGSEVDMWSAGCVIYEIVASESLFKFKEDAVLIEIIEDISKICGSPNPSVWQNVTNSKYYNDVDKTGIAFNYSRRIDESMEKVPYEPADILKQIFLWDPSKRISARQCLSSPWLENIKIVPMKTHEFPDKDCHNYLLEYGDIVPQPLSESKPTTRVVNKVTEAIDASAATITSQIPNTEDNKPHQEEEMLKFVQNLSGRILELGEILDQLREEPPCTPEIVRGVILHAARKWSKTEQERIKLVEFMLNYLLRDAEKDQLKL